MEIALVVPAYGAVTGNSISARRILQGIVASGARAKVLDLETLGVYIPNIIAAYEPDVVHAFHARKTGFLVRDSRPLVISLTGTDVGRDLDLPGSREEVLAACRAAHALVVHQSETAAPLLEADHSLASKIRVVPKGMGLVEEAPFAIRAAFSIPPDRPLFLMPGGLRPVKGQLRAIHALDDLGVELVIAGPRLDEEYAKKVVEAARERPWVRLIEIRPHARMAGAYRESDVVLNASDLEGMSNAILEAMYFSRPVLASDIPGNRGLVESGVTGLTFRTDAEFREAARRLATDAALRATLGAAGAIRARARHSAEAEAKAMMEIYREAAATMAGVKRTPTVLP
ncbi:MAG: group 1 glycosyl [Planctomycetota bacterium]|nr:MAG: group 1 glycosyl [Planctomycetota bacterium]